MGKLFMLLNNGESGKLTGIYLLVIITGLFFLIFVDDIKMEGNKYITMLTIRPSLGWVLSVLLNVSPLSIGWNLSILKRGKPLIKPQPPNSPELTAE